MTEERTVTPADIVTPDMRKGAVDVAATRPGVEKYRRRSDAAEVQRVVRCILDSRVTGSGAVNNLLDENGEVSLDTLLSNPDSDVKTRILTLTAKDACSGNYKAAEFLFKIGDLNPAQKSSVEVSTPTIIDDVSQPEVYVPMPKTLDDPALE